MLKGVKPVTFTEAIEFTGVATKPANKTSLTALGATPDEKAAHFTVPAPLR